MAPSTYRSIGASNLLATNEPGQQCRCFADRVAPSGWSNVQGGRPIASGLDRNRARDVKVFDKTSGHCHFCGAKLTFRNFGRHKRRRNWVIDHIDYKSGPNRTETRVAGERWQTVQSDNNKLSIASSRGRATRPSVLPVGANYSGG
jgi:hypothetical protein